MLTRTAIKLIILATVCVAHAQTPKEGRENPKDYTTHVVGYAHIDVAGVLTGAASVRGHPASPALAVTGG